VEETARNMTPIRQLLNRIHWDQTFSQADFLIGYLDRIENRIIRAGLREIRFPEDTPDSFIRGAGRRRPAPPRAVSSCERGLPERRTDLAEDTLTGSAVWKCVLTARAA